MSSAVFWTETAQRDHLALPDWSIAATVDVAVRRYARRGPGSASLRRSYRVSRESHRRSLVLFLTSHEQTSATLSSSIALGRLGVCGNGSTCEPELAMTADGKERCPITASGPSPSATRR